MKKSFKVSLVLGAIFLLALDFLSKWLVFSHLDSEIIVFQNLLGISFSIVHVINTGVAWGMLTFIPNALPFLRIAIILSLLIYLFFFNKKPAFIVPITMIMVGATGNVIDYFVYGHVIDMFYFNLWGYSFPVFNVADSLICLGMIWIIILQFLEKRHGN